MLSTFLVLLLCSYVSSSWVFLPQRFKTLDRPELDLRLGLSPFKTSLFHPETLG